MGYRTQETPHYSGPPPSYLEVLKTRGGVPEYDMFWSTCVGKGRDHSPAQPKNFGISEGIFIDFISKFEDYE